MRVIIFALALALLSASAHAQQQSPLQQQLNAAFDACIAKKANGELKTRTQTVGCMNDGITPIYLAAHWPYMSSVYHFEATVLLAASQADAGKITEQEYVAQYQAAFLQMNAEAQERYESQQAATAQSEQDAAANDAARREDNRQAILRALLQQNAISRPAPQPTYQMPTNSPVHCTTSYIGNQAETQCQ